MENEVTYSFMAKKGKDICVVVDTRSEDEFLCGHIPGAINIPESQLLASLDKFSKEKEYYLCSKTGECSQEAAANLQNRGIKAFALIGGYVGWLKESMGAIDPKNKAREVEESIRKKFHRKIFSKFCKAINEYELLKPNDKVAVCISGGKDSMLMAKLFQELQRHNKFDFELVFLVMNPGYSPENLEIIKKNAEILNIPITIFETNIFENVFSIEKSPCYICARMRRGYLYSEAKKLGCNKIALGHHYDDVIETILMGMLYGAQVQTMMPKLHSTNFSGMELIRPMYLIREEDIIAWRDYNCLNFIQCACKFTENCHLENSAFGSTSSKRKKVKNLIAMLKKDDPQVDQNIFASVENVNLSTVIAYKDKSGVVHNFKDDYEN